MACKKKKKKTVEDMKGVGHYTWLALNRAGYNTPARLARASLEKLANLKVGKHRIRIGEDRAKKLKRTAARMK